MIKVAVIGGSGFTGMELIKILKKDLIKFQYQILSRG